MAAAPRRGVRRATAPLPWLASAIFESRDGRHGRARHLAANRIAPNQRMGAFDGTGLAILALPPKRGGEHGQHGQSIVVVVHDPATLVGGGNALQAVPVAVEL